MQRRRRFKQTTSLNERLAKFARQMRELAGRMPAGQARSELLNKAKSADAAVQINELVSSHEQPNPQQQADG